MLFQFDFSKQHKLGKHSISEIQAMRVFRIPFRKHTNHSEMYIVLIPLRRPSSNMYGRPRSKLEHLIIRPVCLGNLSPPKEAVIISKEYHPKYQNNP